MSDGNPYNPNLPPTSPRPSNARPASSSPCPSNARPASSSPRPSNARPASSSPRPSNARPASSSPRLSNARSASRGHLRTGSYGSGRHNLASRAGSDVNSTAGSVWSDHTHGTENTYLREFKPSFSSYSQYIFTVLAAVISAKEIWRFPYTVMGHDSGIFVLLYLIMTLSVGIPLVYLELIIGVRFRVGAIKCFNAMGERATGIGVSQLVLSFLILVYQPLIMAWSLYFIFVSFGTMTTIPPWSTCPVINGTMSTCCIQDSSTYYWFEGVLNVSTGLADPEPTHQTHLVVCYVITWFIAYLCILRGVRISAMISYVTVTIPLMILLIIFVRVLFLDGALIGLVTFITPNLGDMNRISVPLMLLDLMSQVNVYGRDPGYPTFEALLIGFLNMTVSVVSALILYAIIGHLMVTKKRTKQEVFVSRGASVVFSVFPNIFSYFLVPNIWSILFFVALVLISIDSMYCHVNAVTLSLMEVGGFRYIPYSILSLVITLTCALTGLPFLMGNGVYLFEAMDGTINPVICMAVSI
ncbi:sodium-dependent neutral amino acid transporter B(0)AT1-like [Bolinopsis microptera]|uniref:sodium-dependent neutral amino acid transporter B(0)AT1-like n=1 Tax=Bolinopsis microptera TaxID=2820187 RepID=UPI00307AAE04